MWGLLDSAHLNTSIYVEFTWYEITPIKITYFYKFEIEIPGEWISTSVLKLVSKFVSPSLYCNFILI